MRSLRWIVALAVLLVVTSSPAGAIKIGGTQVVVPVVMHGPGAEGTEWRTDLWISNWSISRPTVDVAYYPEGGGTPMMFTVSFEPWQTVEIVDLVLTRFGLNNSKGLLLLSSHDQVSVEARARIYNTGNPNGEFGQFVPGVAMSWLARQAYLPGLSGIDGNRTNVGIANPLEQELELTLRFTDTAGVQLANITRVTVPARSVLQINDIFAFFGVAPQGNAQLDITTSSLFFYGYASVVRTGTGDAIFIFGSSPNY